MQAEKAKLERDLAALQVKLDTREVQLQDVVRQLNISKFMLSESDEARNEVCCMCIKRSTEPIWICNNSYAWCRFRS